MYRDTQTEVHAQIHTDTHPHTDTYAADTLTTTGCARSSKHVD